MRVLIFDLLAERSEFGHGGNLQMIKHLTNNLSELDVFLVTPQYQDTNSLITKNLTFSAAERISQPLWNNTTKFESSFSEIVGETSVNFTRINMPVGEISELSNWLRINQISCVFCSGSRMNISEPEIWMDSAKKLILGIIEAKVPFLGICFGHQLLSNALGCKVERSESRTDIMCKLELTKLGLKDPLFSELIINDLGPTTLFTHQDHVRNLIQNNRIKLNLLGVTPHCEFAAVRISIDDEMLPIWGVQFHPEATNSMIVKSYELGDITYEEKELFNNEHDGNEILKNFCSVVVGMINLS